MEQHRSRTVSIRAMEEFIALSNELNFSTTAKRLYMSQPTLSNHIRALEENMGVALLKHGQKPELTPCGNIFLQYAENIVAYYDELLASMERYQNDSCSVSIEDLALTDSVINAIESFESSFPTVRINLCSIANYHTIEALEQEILDIARLADVDDENNPGFKQRCDDLGLSAIKVATERPIAWMRKDHPLASKETITLEDIADYPVIMSSSLHNDGWRALIEKLFSRVDITPSIFSRATSSISEFLLTSVNKGEIFILPESLAASHNILSARGLKRSYISSLDQCQYHVYLVSLKSNKNPVLSSFIEAIEGQIRKNAQ